MVLLKVREAIRSVVCQQPPKSRLELQQGACVVAPLRRLKHRNLYLQEDVLRDTLRYLE